MILLLALSGASFAGSATESPVFSTHLSCLSILGSTPVVAARVRRTTTSQRKREPAVRVQNADLARRVVSAAARGACKDLMVRPFGYVPPSVATTSSVHRAKQFPEPSTVETASTPRPVASSGSSTLAGSESSHDARSRTKHSTIPNFLPGEEQHLRDLVLTLLTITTKLIGVKLASGGSDLDSYIDLMLSSGLHQENMCGDSPSIDQFRKACLLAFYEFHQFPGQQAWVRIGKLTRMAYWIGLDRLDRLENSHLRDPSWGTMGQDELEDWRLVWWFIYRLDTYANLSSGTPYLIDERLMRTALMCDQQLDCQPESQQSRQGPKPYLPPHPGGLWQLIPTITSDSPQTSLFNLHIITATATRHVGRALQLHMMMGPSGETATSLADLERSLSALRLSLPKNYLNPMRNAFLNETRSDHHLRLVTVLHLLMARLLISIMNCSSFDEGDEWLLSWQKVLETCQDMASISEQWNSAFTLSVDPAVSFIIFTGLIFVDLHKKFTGATDSSLQSNLEHCEMVLLLLLEQFANTWTLPRLLLLSFKGFREMMMGPLSYFHIQSILVRFEAPLHPRWLQFLSTAPADLETELVL
ncbi:hypothetical protein EDB81DRAFT_842828 [Dactylonectria macrodidyma]|uniref:Xylanolytic transcriptional activator regulatory domain-containing protein n=1 Tax=Dactylonectria macrodidyma TaxID=307937 RepID=A0A9P9J6G3_9HYPO|nr:hypothetical protein EDB81DRAFT_842828 [Dactylonectria macrodidyma]